MSNYLELAIIAFIIVGIAVAIWRGGAANPVGTGKLQRDVASMKAKIAELERNTKGTAKASDLAHLKEEMERNQGERTETMVQLRSEISKIGEEVDALQKECADRLARVEANTATTAQQVNRLYDHIVTKGMSS